MSNGMKLWTSDANLSVAQQRSGLSRRPIGCRTLVSCQGRADALRTGVSR